eukprot:15433758-Alexandrium_andersonii.AAC.1
MSRSTPRAEARRILGPQRRSLPAEDLLGGGAAQRAERRVLVGIAQRQHVKRLLLAGPRRPK